MEDKGAETQEHIDQVRIRMTRAVIDLQERRHHHDASKLEDPELSGFYEMNAISKRSDVVYGSEEYKALMRSQKPVIEHHYAHNDHHPEHWRFHKSVSRMEVEDSLDDRESGLLVSCMSLPALIEMLCDWDAAAMRYKDGSFGKSFKGNCDRFGIGPQLAAILTNTAVSYGFMTEEDAQ